MGAGRDARSACEYIVLYGMISIDRYWFVIKSSLTSHLLKSPHGNRSTEQILNIQPDATGSQSEKGKKRYARLS